MVSQKHELAVWRPAPLLCITAQVTARDSHKTKELIIKAEEVNHSVLLNSSLHYVFKWLAGHIQLSQNLFWQPPHPQYFPQELHIHFMIIFTRIKTTALTKCLLIGLWLLSLKLLRYGLCHVHLRMGLQALSSQVQQKSYLMRAVSQKYWLTAVWNHTLVTCSISRLMCNGHKTTDKLNARLSKQNRVQTLATTSTFHKMTEVG